MGAKGSKNKELQRLQSKFDHEEVAMLQQAFQDLADRSKGKTIDKLTFTKVFQLPGILGGRLFSAFDRKHIGAIDYEEFIAGLGFVVRGTLDEKIDFLFRMYDLAGHGFVTRTELTTMLNSVVFAAYTILDASADGDKFTDDIANALNNRVKEMVSAAFANQETDNLTKEEFKRWAVDHIETLDILDYVFSNSAIPTPDHLGRSHHKRPSSVDKEKITFDGILHSSPTLSPNPSFRQHPAPPARLKKLSNSFSYPLFSSFIDEESRSNSPIHERFRSESFCRRDFPGVHIACQMCHHVIDIRNCCLCGRSLRLIGSTVITCDECIASGSDIHCRFCFHCGFDLSLNDKPLEPMFGRIIPEDRHSQMEGWLYKVGHMFKTLKLRWFMLKDNFMYTFHNDSEVKPSGVFCLEGCFVEPVNHEEKNVKMKYGIEISMSQGNSNSRFYYAKDERSRNDWCVAIRHAARQFVLEDYYEIGSELGTGKFSSVCGCTHKATGKKYAVKIIDKTGIGDAERELLRTEIAVLQLVHHPNIIHLKNVFETKSKIYIITTLVEGGDLFDRITKKHRFTEENAKCVIKMLLGAVQYLHDRGIVHRDLKPENIMMTSVHSDCDIQVADFGLSKFTSPEESMDLPCGTLAYVAPEVLQMCGYGREVDLWSIGVIMYVLLRGRLPFDAKRKEDIIEKTLKGKLPMEGDAVWESISADAKSMVRKLLCPDPKKRLTVEQALQEPWLTSPDTAI